MNHCIDLVAVCIVSDILSLPPVSPSSSSGPVQVTKVNAEKERVSLRCMKALASRGGVDAVSQQMASHPQYLESFLRTQHYILHMDGPLPLQYRHYIAIMVRPLDTRYTHALHDAQKCVLYFHQSPTHSCVHLH